MIMLETLQSGSNSISRPSGTAVVIFGATGDLNKRKLIPALYNLYVDGYLPKNFAIVGVSRTKLNDHEFRESLKVAVSEFSRSGLNAELWEKFSQSIYYVPGNAHQSEGFSEIKIRLEEISKKHGGKLNYLYYLATSPEHFAAVAENLKGVGLVAEVNNSQNEHATRLVVEKPFGRDLASAKELNYLLRKSFDESQIYRIDHYLGKETVQNILVFRFVNGIFEPLLNRNFVDHIQVTVAEDIGLGTRAGYFDKSGILRDIVQNHQLQMLSLLCIEPPISLSDPNSIRDEKVKVLRSLRRFDELSVKRNIVRAQYTRGEISGNQASGYLEESGVVKNSKTETYVAMRLEIDNWRWAGVPIYVRAGKRLGRRITELTVHFRQPPRSQLLGQNIELESNVLAIQVQPNEGISLRVGAKPPGPKFQVRQVEMDFRYGQSFETKSADAYERLLLDAMKGDPTLFIRDDEIEEAWAFLAPIFDVWNRQDQSPVYEYRAGSWGPAAADELLERRGHAWRKL
jgi:glucose-6-phosphate 1-dehydrogenase